MYAAPGKPNVPYALGFYAAACIFAWHLSRRLSYSKGKVAALCTIAANVLPVVPGVPLMLRFILSPAILGLTISATAGAFRRSDDERRDRERAETWTKAGMALAGIAVLEAALLVIGGLIWLAMQDPVL